MKRLATWVSAGCCSSSLGCGKGRVNAKARTPVLPALLPSHKASALQLTSVEIQGTEGKRREKDQRNRPLHSSWGSAVCSHTRSDVELTYREVATVER